jgi:hypothetical protein
MRWRSRESATTSRGQPVIEKSSISNLSHKMSKTVTEAQPAPSNATIPVRLTTRDSRYAIPDSKYLVPADWRRFQLSELINKVLENGEPGQRIRSSRSPRAFWQKPDTWCACRNGNSFRLSHLRRTFTDVDWQLCSVKGLVRGLYIPCSSSQKQVVDVFISQESVLEIEYIESVLPPKFLSSFEHDDWVSDVSLARRGYVSCRTGRRRIELHLTLCSFTENFSPPPILPWPPYSQLTSPTRFKLFLAILNPFCRPVGLAMRSKPLPIMLQLEEWIASCGYGKSRARELAWMHRYSQPKCSIDCHCMKSRSPLSDLPQTRES